MSKIGKNRFFTFLIFVLIAIVGVQGYFLYTMNNKLDSFETTTEREKSKSETALDWDSLGRSIENQAKMNKKFIMSMHDFFNSIGQVYLQDEETPLKVSSTEDKDEVLIRIEIPAGVNKDNLKVSIKDDQILIQGTQTESSEEHDDQGNVTYKSEKNQSFLRSECLPKGVDPSSLKTDYNKGILTLSFKKQ